MGTDQYDKLSQFDLFIKIESRYEIGEINSLDEFKNFLIQSKHFKALEKVLKDEVFFENVILIC